MHLVKTTEVTWWCGLHFWPFIWSRMLHHVPILGFSLGFWIPCDFFLFVFFFMKQHSPGSTEILMIISQWGVLQVCAMNNSQQADYHLETKKGQTGLDSNLEWDELKSAYLFWREKHHSAPTSCNFSGAKQSLRSDLVLIERRITGEITSGPPSNKRHTQQLAVTPCHPLCG